jgi:hypothetical protein
MTLPNELKQWPVGRLHAILTAISTLSEGDLVPDEPEDHTILTDLWRHDYIVLRDDLVLDEGETAQLEDLRLSEDGLELLDRIRSGDAATFLASQQREIAATLY